MTTLEEARSMAAGYPVVPISKEIIADRKTPIEVLGILKGVSSHCYMLESVENQERWGRYTFLGYDPVMEITCTDGVMTIRGDGKDSTKKVEHPRETLAQILKEYRARLEAKVAELLADTQLDENRIAAEVTIFADKICVDEETVRLRSHVEATKNTLSEGGSVGRKLDFIAQEMNREANTILSKANDLAISDTGINLKTDIEKVREQIQNIE